MLGKTWWLLRQRAALWLTEDGDVGTKANSDQRAFSLCNSGLIPNIKWDTQLQYLESLLGFIFIRHRLTLVHFLGSVCEIYVVISSYVCITRKVVLPHELYPFRSFYSSWIKGYTGNLGRSELNWINVWRKWLTNPKSVAIESWGRKKAKTLYQTDAFWL